MELFGVHWAYDSFFWTMPLFLGAIVVVVLRYFWLKRVVFELAAPEHFGRLFKNFSLRRALVKMCLWIMAITALFLALLRPQWTKKEQTLNQTGRDVVIVLDISRSMLAQDVRPDRLAFAKLKLRALLEELKFDRVALVLFSGSAFLQCPLTRDHSAFLMFLNAVEVEKVSPGTTALDKALKRALEVFARDSARKNKLVLLVTDGEDFSLDLAGVKEQAAKEGAIICALGIGTPEGAPVPKFDRYGAQIGHEVDSAGAPYLTKLNEELLQSVALQLRGLYVRSAYGDEDVEKIAAFIDSFEREKFEDRKISHYEDRYPIFIGIAGIALMLEWLL